MRTSAMAPYGLCMNSSTAPEDIFATAQKKKPSKAYLSARSGMSIQRGSSKLRCRNLRPIRHRDSERVPTGQSQLQNALRNRNAIARNDEEKHRGRVSCGDVSGCEPILEVHH